jgi:hypothetical protein
MGALNFRAIFMPPSSCEVVEFLCSRTDTRQSGIQGTRVDLYG